MKTSTTHLIERTSPKGTGQRFEGTCSLCGTAGLSFSNMNDYCPNQRGLTDDEAVLEAVDRGDRIQSTGEKS